MTGPSAEEAATAGSMVRAEQRLTVGSEWVAMQCVTAHRRIVSEVVQLNVTVRREELVFDQASLPPTVAQLPIPYVPPLVVVLHEEVPVVSLAVQPYERVTISVVQVAGDQQIATTLDSEQITLDIADPAPTVEST